MSFTSIRNALKTKLDSIKAALDLAAGDTIEVVYDYNETNISGYPAVLIESQSMNSDFGSNRENLRSYVFSITIHQPVETTTGREVGTKRLDYVVDAIIDAMDIDFTLSGAVEQLTPIGADKSFIEDSEVGKKAVFTLNFQAQVFSPVINNC